jgi:carbonic anhydrase
MSSIQELPNSKKGGHPETNPYQAYDFQAANEHYAKHSHKPDPIVGARSRVGIITCTDARCIPERFFELTENEAFVIRNGGGRTATEDVIRTLLLIQVLSEVKELKIVHHTDCGALAYSEEWVRDLVAANDPSAPGGPFKKEAFAWSEAIAYQPFTTRPNETERERVERSVRQDVEYLKSHPLIKPTVLITGWVYDLHTGKTEQVLQHL